jgi:hypothetical protein
MFGGSAQYSAYRHKQRVPWAAAALSPGPRGADECERLASEQD